MTVDPLGRPRRSTLRVDPQGRPLGSTLRALCYADRGALRSVFEACRVNRHRKNASVVVVSCVCTACALSEVVIPLGNVIFCAAAGIVTAQTKSTLTNEGRRMGNLLLPEALARLDNSTLKHQGRNLAVFLLLESVLLL